MTVISIHNNKCSVTYQKEGVNWIETWKIDGKTIAEKRGNTTDAVRQYVERLKCKGMEVEYKIA